MDNTIVASKTARKAFNSNLPSFEEYLKIFEQAGGTDTNYLKGHYYRFITAYGYLEPRLGEKKRILDIGAHWLHQALLYSLNGHNVIAADFPATLALAAVKKLAVDHNITLIEYSSLEDEAAFDILQENSIDCVLFSEILEHITFNPINFWKGVYRILSPGAKIVITTPNYYSASGKLKKISRFIKGFGEHYCN